MAVKTYSSLDVSAIINGIKLTGWNTVSLSAPNQRWDTAEDASDGDTTFIEQPGWKKFQADIAAMQSGSANDVLYAIYLIGSTVLFTLVDGNGTTLVNARVKVNWNDAGFSADATDKNYTLIGRNDVSFIGGNGTSFIGGK